MDMHIAVTSQTRTTVTGHAGRCRHFLVFDIADGKVASMKEVDLQENETFHQAGHELPRVLEGINALVTGGMGNGLFARLVQLGIRPFITDEQSPEKAALACASGAQPSGMPHAHGAH